MRASFLCWAFGMGLVLAQTGCSGASGSDVSGSPSGGGSSAPGGGAADGETLFKSPQGSATPGTVLGVWGGSTEDGGITFDVRMKLGASSLTMAVRCEQGGRTTPVAGVTVSARVSDEELAILESKQDVRNNGDLKCSAHPKPGSLPRCSPKDEHFEKNCFTLTGTTLTMYGDTTFDKLVLTKLSD